jgi:hydroxyacyl-ACP dehydratase HTD2-like protein with hotdog domain
MDLSDLDHLVSSVGRRELRHDRSASELLNALAATLDDSRRFSFGMAVPPLWHWIFFRPEAAQAELREDGHPVASGLLPPIPLPRRMWAGSRLHLGRPLLTEHVLTRETTIDKVVEKRGTEGLLVFVTLRHEIADEAGAAIVEEQDLVYRQAPSRDMKTRSGLAGPGRSECRAAVSLFGPDLQRASHSLRSPLCRRCRALPWSRRTRSSHRDFAPAWRRALLAGRYHFQYRLPRAEAHG